MKVAQAVKLLKSAGAKVTRTLIKADIADGAPTNDDGTINLIHYTAWLIENEQRRPAT
ncbi:MAG: hypothetical protein AAGG38_06305 [Planctomycetota bacterium]